MENEVVERIRDAVSFGLFAAEFVTQVESWPVFAAWARSQGVDQDFSREMALELLNELAFGISTMGGISGDDIISAQT